jgi:phospholipase C
VSWVFAPEGKGLSEHPPENVTDGMNWTVEQVNAMVQGELWSNSAIFITWDDWGGWFDHVDPPNVETWNDDGTHPFYDNTQFRYGSRVGCIVLSPYAKSGYISTAAATKDANTFLITPVVQDPFQYIGITTFWYRPKKISTYCSPSSIV